MVWAFTIRPGHFFGCGRRAHNSGAAGTNCPHSHPKIVVREYRARHASEEVLALLSLTPRATRLRATRLGNIAVPFPPDKSLPWAARELKQHLEFGDWAFSES